MEFLEKYPITVVIPTRNSMPGLKAHIAALNVWIHRAQQVVVVDSESIDGTLEYLRANLEHDCVEFLDHPPGLYESWNAAIQLVSSEYTYIATVNDLMPWETLLRLYGEAARLNADVVVSAPEIVCEDSSSRQRKWPIHCLLEQSVPKETYLLQPLELLVWNSVYLPRTLIGSSASNLYRSAALQENPFPCDYGHAGDSAWAVAQSFSLRWVVVPEVASNFQYHEAVHEYRLALGRQLRAQLYALSLSQMEYAENELTLSGVEADILDALSHLYRLWGQKEKAVLGYQTYRRGRAPWVFLPRAWMLRSGKNRAEIEVSHQVEAVLAKVGDYYGYKK